jgi:hypothetical protein
VGDQNTTKFDLFVEKYTLQIINFLIFGAVALVVFRLIRRNNERLGKVLLFAFSFIILNSFVYALSPGRSADIPLVDSRNLYFPLIGAALLLVLLLWRAAKEKSVQLMIFLLPFLFLNAFQLNREIRSLVREGQVRKDILVSMKRKYPDLPNKVIFYTESDSSFYGLPFEEKILPFQSGLGQTLLVWYQQTERFPSEFFQDRFLWEITEEGYREIEERGFGYFRDFEKLVKALKENNLSEEAIIAFRYNSEISKLDDITNEVRGRVDGFLSEKRILPSNLYSLKTSENQELVSFLIDRKRQTFWQSRISYHVSQFIEVKLIRPKRIAQIVIDSYNNRDQNQVGYSILLSDDGREWKEVFYAKYYPPDKDGLVNMYIKPQQARYIRIQQEGFHESAPWAIHELEIYEAI